MVILPQTMIYCTKSFIILKWYVIYGNLYKKSYGINYHNFNIIIKIQIWVQKNMSIIHTLKSYTIHTMYIYLYTPKKSLQHTDTKHKIKCKHNLCISNKIQ